ncbi:MAG: TolC family protein [Flavobacteriaceae bacterium]
MIKVIISIALFILSITFSFGQKQWSLQECVNYALENNISLKRAQLNTTYSQEDVTITKARLLPSVTASASQNVGIGNKYKRFNPSNNFGIAASYNIYNGGRNKLQVQQAEKNIEINQINVETLQSNISLQIANNYLNALFNKENIKLANEQINITTIQINKMQELIDAGVKPRAELLDIQATLASNNEQLTQSENALDLSLLNLAQLIQVPSNNFDIQDVTINLDKAILTYSNTDGIYNAAYATRPEIKKATLDIEQAELGIKIAKTDLMPNVNASYGLNTSYAYRLSGDGKFNNIADQYFDNHGHNFGISASYTIFDGQARKASIRKAKINKEIIEQGLEDEKLKLRETIERAYLDAKASLKQYESSLSSLKAQEESFNIANVRYKLGAMNSFDFDLVKSRLFNSKIKVINAKYNFVFKSKVLDFYNGIPIVIE